MSFRLLATPLLIAAFAAAPACAETALDTLVDSRDVICEFRNTAAPASRLRRMIEGERYDMLLVIEGIDAQAKRARATSSKQVGTKGVRVYKTANAVHFVQDLAESVIVTTVTGCEKWGRKAGQKQCVRYRALNSWHFDTSVHRYPDISFGKLKTSSYSGTCEPWYLNGVTTSERDREALRLTGRNPASPQLQAAQHLDVGDDAVP